MPLRPTFLYGQGAGRNIQWTVSYPPAIASQDLDSHHVARESFGSPYLRYSLVRNRREPASHELKDDPQDHRDCILDPHPLESSSRGREFPLHLAVIKDFKGSQLCDFSGQILGRLVARGVNLPIAFPSQSQKIVVLANDLSSWA